MSYRRARLVSLPGRGFPCVFDAARLLPVAGRKFCFILVGISSLVEVGLADRAAGEFPYISALIENIIHIQRV